MDLPVADVERFPEKIEDEKEGGPSFHCDLYDTEVVHKIAQAFIPGLATACVDNTTGDIFRFPGSVAADIRKEMIDYVTQRSESFVAEHIVLEGGSEVEASNDPLEIISDFMDDFATSKRNLFGRVSGWLLSERREDNIDDFAQEMEINGFWLMDHREAIAQTLLKNVDFRNSFHCKMNFKTREELAEHVEHCGYRSMHCENEGCTAVFCANQMENHDSVCPFKIIPCEQNCSVSLMRREMDRHCITVCPMKLVNCPFYSIGCESGVPQCKLQQHRLDDLSSHLMYILRCIYKEASADDLEPRVEQIKQLSTRLAEARDARTLTNLVKDIDLKLGPLVMKPKEIKPKDEVNKGEHDTTDSTVIASEETENKSLELGVDIRGKVEDEESEISLEKNSRIAPEDDAKESEKGLADGLMEEAARKDSEGEMKNDLKERGVLKDEETRETDGTNKGEETKSSEAHLLEGTETKAPEVVVMDEDREGTLEIMVSRTRVPAESEGSEVQVTENFDEEGTQTKNSTNGVSKESKTETPLMTVMDKKDEEATQTMNSTTHVAEKTETEAPPTIGMDKADEETHTTKNSTTHASEESETESASTILMEKADAETMNSMAYATKESETETPSTKLMEKADGEGTQTMNTSSPASDESETEALQTIVMEKTDEEGTQTMNSTTHTSTEAETEVSQITVTDKADEVGTQTMNSQTHVLLGEVETKAPVVASTDKKDENGTERKMKMEAEARDHVS